MTLEVLNSKGEKTGRTVDLNENIFAVKPNDHAIYLDVKQYLAHQRQGTHKTKEKSEVSRSTRKLFQQKGTGRARAGSLKSPVFKGGGTVFGPRPRKYGFKLNKKVKLLARKSALSYKVSGQALSVVEDFTFDEPKTKNYVAFLKNLKLAGVKTLLVVPKIPQNLKLSARNLPGAAVMNAGDVNTYQIMKAKNLILSESSVKVLDTLLT
ncbi:MAG: 50S ribosomal protein L4 [Bacteroidetes bacterium]|nr:50S ribosomal protein L4 [Bacteroidota bacterium]